MSVAQQAKAARRKARIDPRYCKQGSRDAAARERKYRAMIEKQKAMQARKGAKKS